LPELGCLGTYIGYCHVCPSIYHARGGIHPHYNTILLMFVLNVFLLFELSEMDVKPIKPIKPSGKLLGRTRACLGSEDHCTLARISS
jgi:hypothetical protein